MENWECCFQQAEKIVHENITFDQFLFESLMGPYLWESSSKQTRCWLGTAFTIITKFSNEQQEAFADLHSFWDQESSGSGGWFYLPGSLEFAIKLLTGTADSEDLTDEECFQAPSTSAGCGLCSSPVDLYIQTWLPQASGIKPSVFDYNLDGAMIYNLLFMPVLAMVESQGRLEAGPKHLQYTNLLSCWHVKLKLCMHHFT